MLIQHIFVVRVAKIANGAEFRDVDEEDEDGWKRKKTNKKRRE
jgi:hypothetical protein